VIVGLVGPRMHKVGAMESQEMRVMEEQNNSKSVAKDSVLQLFANFYGMERVATYKEVRTAFDHKEVGVFAALKRTFQRGGLQVQTEDFLPVLTTRPIIEESYLHLPAYTQRIRMVADMLLAEANDRARREGKTAFVHVVGLGLGVWQISPKQKPIFAGIFLDALVDLKPDHVSDLALSWVFEPALVGGKWELPKEFDWGNRRAVDGSKIGDTETTLHICRREPWEKVSEGKMVVASFAWDGMSFVGNEYWAGSTATSSDPAAASCTQIPELLNPSVNPVFCAANSRLVTKEGKLITLKEHQTQTR